MGHDRGDSALIALQRTAKRIAGVNARPGLPVLWALTDPARAPDLVGLAKRLPEGAGLIYRHFGRPDLTAAREAARLAQGRGLTFLIAADPHLAQTIGAHGVHWPNAMLGRVRRVSAARFLMETASAHNAAELRRADMAGVDAALLSPVFASQSPSAGRPMGSHRLAGLAARARTPVIALGGITRTTARRLFKTGVCGIAAVAAVA